MSPQEALQLIDQNISQLNGTREAHATLQLAIQVLSLLVAEHSNEAIPIPQDDKSAE